jgi:hypothetical protein
MACRIAVRVSKANRLAGGSNNNGVQVSRCFQAAGTGRQVHWKIANSSTDETPATPTGIRRFNAYVPSERRRIVAQVRRKLLKNRDFFAARDSIQGRDDLFTTGVDNADRAGL